MNTAGKLVLMVLKEIGLQLTRKSTLITHRIELSIKTINFSLDLVCMVFKIRYCRHR